MIQFGLAIPAKPFQGRYKTSVVSLRNSVHKIMKINSYFNTWIPTKVVDFDTNSLRKCQKDYRFWYHFIMKRPETSHLTAFSAYLCIGWTKSCKFILQGARLHDRAGNYKLRVRFMYLRADRNMALAFPSGVHPDKIISSYTAGTWNSNNVLSS